MDRALPMGCSVSKTDQGGRGAYTKLGISSIEICPVLALDMYLEQRGNRPGYLFCHMDGSLLTKYQLWKVTGTALEQIGLAVQ